MGEHRRWGAGGPTALLVHGLFADAGNWWRVGPALADHGHHVVAPDLLGHGTAPRLGPEARYTPHGWADALVADVGTTPVDLAIGHSLGGLVLALALERLQPRRSVFLDPTWCMSAAQHEQFAALWREQLEWTTRKRWQDAYPTWDPGDLDSRMESRAAMDPRAIDGLAPGGGHDLRPSRPVGRCLVVAADPSAFVPPADQAALAERGFDVKVLDGVGHAAFREAFDDFMELLLGWLDEPG
jgi:pimeloyl-ACP methyl ester carboxylesterase